jgi:hypothetical protein
MKMKTTHLMSVAALLPVLAVAADARLFTFNVSELADSSGTRVSMKFEEISRRATSSMVEMSGPTPGSDPPKGYLLGGMCGLAKARSQKYFQAKVVQAEPLMFEVTFPNFGPDSPTDPGSFMAPNVYPVSQCPVLTYTPGRRVDPTQRR